VFPMSQMPPRNLLFVSYDIQDDFFWTLGLVAVKDHYSLQ